MSVIMLWSFGILLFIMSSVHGVEEPKMPMLGGWNNVDLKTRRDEMMDLARKAVKLHAVQSNENEVLAALDVKKASSQVVAGWNYKLDVLVARLTCSNKAQKTACPVTSVTTCTYKIYKGFDGQNELTDVTCGSLKKL